MAVGSPRKMSDEATNPGHPSAIEEYYRFTAHHTQQVTAIIFLSSISLHCSAEKREGERDTMMKNGKKDKR